jgi:hypothetical protein
MREQLSRPTNRQLGAWVADCFEDRRAITREIIEAQLADLKEQKDEVTLVSIPESMRAVPVDRSDAGPTKVMARRPAAGEAMTAEKTAAEGPAAEAVEPRPARSPSKRSPSKRSPSKRSPSKRARPARSRAGRLVARSVAAVVAVGAMAFAVVTHLDRASRGAEAGSSEEVTLILRAVPHEVRFTIDDGAPVDSPYIARVKRDGSEHRIVAAAPGFAPRTQTVTFSGDVSLRFALAREGAVDAGGRRALTGVAVASADRSGHRHWFVEIRRGEG